MNENDDDKVSLLYSAWSSLLNESQEAWTNTQSSIPNAPHLEKCKSKGLMNKRLDTRVGNATFPPWTLWKGSLDIYSNLASELNDFRHQDISQGAYPPWVCNICILTIIISNICSLPFVHYLIWMDLLPFWQITGSNEENYPLTRKVQRDVWLHQHPLNCGDPQVKFLVADWETLPGFGIGAQIAGMCGLLALAITENRVLVTNYYNRADHQGCQGNTLIPLNELWASYKGVVYYQQTKNAECFYFLQGHLVQVGLAISFLKHPKNVVIVLLN